MPYFHYWIRTADGKTSEGQREAADGGELRDWLETRGLLVLSICETIPRAARPMGAMLSASESESVLAEVAELQGAQLSLADGLRAMSRSSRGRLAVAMENVADALEQGASLDDALRGIRLSTHHRGLLLAAMRSQRPAEVLLSVMEMQRLDREARDSIWFAVAYPLMLFGITLLIFFGTMVFVVRPFGVVFLEWELNVSVATRMVLWWSDVGVWIVVALVLLLASVAVTARALLGAARWQQLLVTLPLLGPLWQWSSAAQFTRLLSIMLSHHVPLPEAVRLVGLAARSADVRDVCPRVAALTEQGVNLSSALAAWPLLPDIVPLYARWGEQHRSLPEALLAVSDLLAGQVHIHATTLRATMPPFILVFVYTFALSIIFSIFLPLMTLMTGLM